MTVSGEGIPDDTYIVTVVDANTVTLNQAATTTTADTNRTFNNPERGSKLFVMSYSLIVVSMTMNKV